MDTSAPNPNWPSSGTHHTVEVFYDGECPLCMREIRLLRWLDRKHRIRFTDIAAADFKATEFGKTPADFMDEIHGRLPDENGTPGEWIIGVEVFRQLYAAVGFGWLVWPTRLPLISHFLDFGYQVFAKNRLRLTGRCNTEACKVRQIHVPAVELERNQQDLCRTSVQ
jgi:predicted DCC family thiol-disulfide oxidoreductase YuxK